jgi:hypothetical protein
MELNILGHIYPKFHVDLLKRAEDDLFLSQICDNTQLSPLFIDGEPQYIIKEIKKTRLKKMSKRSRRKVLVKWKKYKKETWKPREKFLKTEALA